MKCEHCGREVKEDAQFCSNCGYLIESRTDETSAPEKSDLTAYIISVLTLLIVLALLTYGGYEIIRRDLNVVKNVSASDGYSDGFNYDSEFTDTALVGRWLCTDRFAADYGDSNFGVEVNILLELGGDGKFTLDYNMTDTGVAAKSLSTSGSYSTEDSVITFTPEENPGMNSYLKRHGKRPSFPYSAEEETFTLQYEDGRKILFTRVKE